MASAWCAIVTEESHCGRHKSLARVLCPSLICLQCYCPVGELIVMLIKISMFMRLFHSAIPPIVRLTLPSNRLCDIQMKRVIADLK